MTFFLIFLSCSQKQKTDRNSEKRIVKNELQTVLDSLKVNGTILIFDYQKNTYYSNNFIEAKKSVIPASTFKIPNSIIGLETGILKDEKSIFKWDGNERAFSIWEKDLTLKEAFQVSCVPCFQELARKIGTERMNKYLMKLNYEKMNFDSETIDNFWLIGKSKISSFQQIDFLKRLFNKQLPIKKTTYETLTNILTIEQNLDFTLSGKTGLAINPNENIGWFVGYLEKKDNVYFFATRISPNNNEIKRNELSFARKKATISALKTLKIMK